MRHPSPAPSQPSRYETARSQSRKRAAPSNSSRSDTYVKRIADGVVQLQQRQLELDIQAKELANRELRQKLDRDALEFEKQQREFRKQLEQEERGSGD